jgi:cytosine/creatinine deaminase
MSDNLNLNNQNQKSWDFKEEILNKIKENGGWSNCHGHIDRAFTLTEQNFEYYQKYHINQKWHLHDKIYKEMTVEDLVERMSRFLDMQISQGVTNYCSFLNGDYAVETKAFEAGQIVKEKYKNKLNIRFAVNTFKSLLKKDSLYWWEKAAEYADIIAGTPRSDLDREGEHLDIVFKTAKKMNKRVQAHVDELHRDYEKELELLCNKTVEYGLEGRVCAVHGVSLSRHNKSYRHKIYQRLKDAGIIVIVCPSAWLDHKRSEELVPFHNSMFPVEEAVAEGVTVALGTDNTHDYTLPLGDGDMWFELRTLATACRFTDIDELVKIATTNGRKVLGLE